MAAPSSPQPAPSPAGSVVAGAIGALFTPVGAIGFRRIAPAAAFQICFLAAVTLLKPAANALVVARFRPEALPFLYVGSAALTAAVTAAAAMLGRRTKKEPMRLALAGAAVAAVTSIALWFGLSSSALLLYLFAESFTTLLAIVFWGAMGDVFDPRESRRAFTLIGGFAMTGAILGGALSQGLARWAGTVTLVAMAAVMLLGAALAFRFHHRLNVAPRALSTNGGTGAANGRGRAGAQGRAGDEPDVWSFLRTHPYPIALAGLVGVLSVLTPLADFVFRERASRTLGEDELAVHFGTQQLWLGIVCTLFQFLLAGRLLHHLGLLRYLALIPAVLLPFAVLVVVVPDPLWPASVLKLVESAFTLSIVPVAVQLLYAPIPDGVRDRVRALVDGLVKKGGLAVGGILLIAAGPWLSGPVPAVLLLAVCAVAAFAWWRLRPAYVAALQSQLGDAPAELPEWDTRSQGLLVSALSAPEPERVLNALSLLESSGNEVVRPHLALLLAHPSDRVVERGVRLAAQTGAQESVVALERVLGSAARRPRAEAAWALGRLAPARARVLLPLLVHTDDPGTRCAALGALAMVGDAQAITLLEGMAARAESAPVAERRELARLYGRLPDPRWTVPLERALEDGDASVRNLALVSVGQGGYLALAERLMAFLTWRDERANARVALAALGDAVVPLVEAALNDRTRPAAVRYELPRVLRRVGTQAAFDALLFSNVRDEAFLHYRIGVALTRLKEAEPSLEADPKRVREALGRRREVYRRLLGTYRDLRAALGDEALLTRVVGDRLDQAYELSFWLLGLLYPPRSMRRIHQHLVGGDPRRRAYALELFENLVDEEDRALVMEQTEAHHRDLPPGTGARLSDHLGFLCHSDDFVLHACARQVARRFGQWTLPPMEDDMGDATVKRLFALEGVEMFAQSDVDDVAAVAQLAREHQFRAGEVIYDEGDPGDALYVIVTGEVEAYRKGERVLTLRAREAFGDVSLLDGAPRPTKNVAKVDTSVLVIDRRDFLDLVSDRPELLKGVLRAVSRQLREVVDLAASASQRRGTGEHPRLAGPADEDDT